MSGKVGTLEKCVRGGLCTGDRADGEIAFWTSGLPSYVPGRNSLR